MRGGLKINRSSDESAARAPAARRRGPRKPFVRVSTETYERLAAYCSVVGVDMIGRVVDEIVERMIPEVEASRGRLRQAAAEAEDLLGGSRTIPEARALPPRRRS